MSVPHPLPGFFRACLVAASLEGASGIILGALASHLPDTMFSVPNGRSILHSAVEIQMWHAIALCALCFGSHTLAQRPARLSALTMLAGTLLFSIPVTCHALWNTSILGLSIARIAPYGGTLLILSWGLLGLAALMKKQT